MGVGFPRWFVFVICLVSPQRQTLDFDYLGQHRLGQERLFAHGFENASPVAHVHPYQINGWLSHESGSPIPAPWLMNAYCRKAFAP
jgi:hypothetical protein